MAAVFLNIENTFDRTQHLDLLYKLSKLKFSISLIVHIGAFFSSSEKIQGCISKVARGFQPVPQIVQYLYK
jgi:hypothetical protein